MYALNLLINVHCQGLPGIDGKDGTPGIPGIKVRMALLQLLNQFSQEPSLFKETHDMCKG